MISIIVPTYNRLAVLKRCIDSVLPQVYDDLEVVVVDDFSQDGTRDYLLELAAKHSFIKVLFNNKNSGVNYSRNRAIEMASKKFTLFLDSDDQLVEGCLSEIRHTIKKYPMVRHFLFFVSYRASEFKDMASPAKISYEDWLTGRTIGDYTHVVRADIMKKYKFFEQFRMYEYLNWLRIKKETSPQLLIPASAVHVELGRNDSLTNSSRLRNITVIKTRFESEKLYYSIYHEDLSIYNPRSLTYKLIETILLGVACGQKNDCRSLIHYADKVYIKWLGTLVTLFPSSFMKYAIIKYSSLKRLQ
jgi:glycosyltransferase involved in cell wall biosynthesis